MDANKVLYDYILDRYGSVVGFSEKSGISLIDLNAVLLKDNVSSEIGMGLKLCAILNIDPEELVSNGEVKEKTKEPSDEKNIYAPGSKTAKGEIYRKCMRLSELEKTKLLGHLEHIEKILKK